MNLALAGQERRLHEDIKSQVKSALVDQRRTGYSKDCVDRFCLDLCDSKSEDSWYSFTVPLPGTNQRTLFIRECYKSIKTQIDKELENEEGKLLKCVITGTPGIGKSLFLIYLAIQLIQKGERVLLIYDPLCILFEEDGNVRDYEEMANLPPKGATEFWKPKMWILFDCNLKFESDIVKVLNRSAHVVVSTSPKRGMLNDYNKPPQPITFHMPIWIFGEMEALSIMSFSENKKWNHRHDILGGIPRKIFEEFTSPELIIKQACLQCDLQKCIELVGTDSMITERNDVVHALIHIDSVSPYRSSLVKFASQTAMLYILAARASQDKLAISQLFNMVNGHPLVGTLLGYIFEPYVIELLHKGGQWPVRKLEEEPRTKAEKKNAVGACKEVVEEVPRDELFTIKASGRVDPCKDVKNGLELNQLYVPMASNFRAIDAWMPGVGVFQVTVNPRHGINAGIAEQLEVLGRVKFYWCVLPDLYWTFTKKNPKNLDQYIICFPYPDSIENPIQLLETLLEGNEEFKKACSKFENEESEALSSANDEVASLAPSKMNVDMNTAKTTYTHKKRKQVEKTVVKPKSKNQIKRR